MIRNIRLPSGKDSFSYKNRFSSTVEHHFYNLKRLLLLQSLTSSQTQMANTDALFAEADTNNDGTLNENEFRNFLSRNSVTGSTGYRNSISAAPYGSAFYETSNYGGDLAYGGTNYNGVSSDSAYRSSVSNMTTDSMSRNVSGGISSGDAVYRASIANTANFQQYETDAQGLFKDKNPQVIRKPAAEGPLTYQQNIQVRFLQPPAVPPPGVRTFSFVLLSRLFSFKFHCLAIDHQRSETTSATSTGTVGRSSACTGSTTTSFTNSSRTTTPTTSSRCFTHR